MLLSVDMDGRVEVGTPIDSVAVVVVPLVEVAEELVDVAVGVSVDVERVDDRVVGLSVGFSADV